MIHSPYLPDNVRERVARRVHPDLTWVTPSGAHDLLHDLKVYLQS